MRVLLLNQFFPPDTAATGQLLADVARALADSGHEVHVLASRRPYGGGPQCSPAREQRCGATVHRVRATGFGRNSTLGRLLDYASFYILAWIKALCLPKPDVCLCLTTPPTIGRIAMTLRRLKGTRIVLWVMDLYPQVAVAYGFMRDGSLMYRRLAKQNQRLYQSAQAVIALGADMKAQLLSAGADESRVHVIPNWVPAESVRAMPAESSALRTAYSPDGACVLMYSGNLGLGHQIETAMAAMAQLPDQPQVRLVLVGEGKARESLEQQAATLQPGTIEFFPPQPLNRLGESLAAGDVHLISQRDRTQGLIVPSKLYGILAAGRPVIFIGPDDCEVARTIRDADCGVIVPNADVAATAAAITALAHDPVLRRDMGRRGREYYSAHLGMRRSASAIAAIVESVP